MKELKKMRALLIIGLVFNVVVMFSFPVTEIIGDFPVWTIGWVVSMAEHCCLCKANLPWLQAINEKIEEERHG